MSVRIVLNYLPMYNDDDDGDDDGERGRMHLHAGCIYLMLLTVILTE